MYNYYEFRPGYYLRQTQNNPEDFQGQALTGGSFSYPVGPVKKLLDSLERRYTNISEDVLGATKTACLRSWPVEFQAGL